MKRFLKIIKRLKPYKTFLGLSIFFNILMAAFTIAGIPLFIPFFELLFNGKSQGGIQETETGIKADLIDFLGDWIVQYDPQSALNTIILLIILVFLLKNVFRYLAHFFIAPVRNGFIRDLRADLFNHLLNMPIQFFKKNQKGDLLARMSMDIQETENSILNILETLIKSPLLIIGSLTFMFYVSVELTLLVLVMIPFTIFIIGGLSRTLKRQSAGAQEKLGQIMSILEESVSGNKIIKSFNAQDKMKEKFAATNNTHKDMLTKLLWRKELGSPLAEVLAILVIATLMYYAANLVFVNKITADTFFAFIYAFFIIIEPAKSFSSAYYSYKKGDAALERLDIIFNKENPIKEAENALPIHTINDSIEFKNVSYKYPESNQYALNNISFRINKGEKIALVGRSGAGKSTIADLMPRFIDCSKGEILIDGISLKKLKVNDLRNLIGIVSQDAILFNDTIAKNISFANVDSSSELIRKAADIANIHDFVMDLDDKYDHQIGEQGNKLSGGQQQRIAIARAVLKNAPVLILDEATSSLDSASEKKVQEALGYLFESKTALVIAHRLSTIQEADRIIVLEEGKIIEEGNHNKLMDKKGEYYKFVQLQSLKNNWES